MHLLRNHVRDYDWGSPTAIPELLGAPPSGGPQAEMWIGAHPSGPSLVVDAGLGLDEYLAAAPEALGARSRDRFGDALPYLMKVLAAAKPLSLQVHPTREQAREGFAAEEAAGVARDDPARNYKDPNHKPEIIVAITDFVALCGFRPAEEALTDLRTLLGEPAPHTLAAGLMGALARTGDTTSFREAVTMLLSGDAEVRTLVEDVTDAALRYPDLACSKTVAWVAENYPADPGVVAALLLNRVELSPGEALFLHAGNIHAYLHGLGIEAMATSDNVLRGGLTSKHIDVVELTRIVSFSPIQPTRVPPVVSDLGGALVTSYRPPAEEFSVHEVSVSATEPCLIDVGGEGPTVMLVTSGSVIAGTPKHERPVLRGDTVFFDAGEPIILRAAAEPATAFLTTTGLAGRS